MAINLDFLRSLDRLQVILKKKIYADTQGGHSSSSYGEGLVFQDYKAYVPGDDFRNIDWKIYARTDKFYIKRFEEERNMTVHILIDSSASMDFGSGKNTKFEYAAEVGLGFSYMAYRNNERFNVNTFTDTTTRIRPGKGRNQLMDLFTFLSNHKVGGKSDFIASMDDLGPARDADGVCQHAHASGGVCTLAGHATPEHRLSGKVGLRRPEHGLRSLPAQPSN